MATGFLPPKRSGPTTRHVESIDLYAYRQPVKASFEECMSLYKDYLDARYGLGRSVVPEADDDLDAGEVYTMMSAARAQNAQRGTP